MVVILGSLHLDCFVYDNSITMIQFIRRTFRSANPVPANYRGIFFHLYMEIAWYGVLAGTTIAFLAVFATRQGASLFQIGLLSSVPALVNLVFSLPAGSWLSRQRIGKAVFFSSLIQRSFYLVMVVLPVLLVPEAQVWTIVLVTFLMSIPGTAMTVGFNSLFGEAVPVEWRGQVVGIRNAILSVVTTGFTLISGQILEHMAFPTGYQVVFAVGIVGALISSVHLYLLSRLVGTQMAEGIITPPRTAAGRRMAVELRQLYQRGLQSLRLDVMRGPFAQLMLLLFGWHLVQFMPIPVITPFVVNELHLSDQVISLATSCFNVTVFLGSLRLSQLTHRFGNKILTGVGIMGLSLFPTLTALGGTGYIWGNLIGGLAWAFAGGALYNLILEKCPGNDRPAYLAWYSLVSNAAILLGSTTGPAIAGVIDPKLALILFGAGRLLAGIAVLRWA